MQHSLVSILTTCLYDIDYSDLGNFLKLKSKVLNYVLRKYYCDSFEIIYLRGNYSFYMKFMQYLVFDMNKGLEMWKPTLLINFDSFMCKSHAFDDSRYAKYRLDPVLKYLCECLKDCGVRLIGL